MKINSKHYLLILLSVITLIASGFGYYFLYEKIISQATNSAKVSSQVSSESEKKNNEKELMNVYSSTDSDRKKLLSFFVYEDTVVQFIEKVEKIGIDSNTELSLSAISNDNEHVKARVEIKGSWVNVLKALFLIENLPYSISTNNILFDQTNTEKSKIWNLTLDIRALSLK